MVNLLTVILTILLADNSQIIQGNASVKTEVRTAIEGEGKAYTKIETEINGQKQVLEENKPGTYSLNVSSQNETSDEATFQNDMNKYDPSEIKQEVSKKDITSIFATLISSLNKLIHSLFSLDK